MQASSLAGIYTERLTTSDEIENHDNITIRTEKTNRGQKKPRSPQETRYQKNRDIMYGLSPEKYKFNISLWVDFFAESSAIIEYFS